VRWDDDVEFRRSNRVSPWDVERLKPLLPNVNPDYLVPRTFVVVNGPIYLVHLCVYSR
jgi:hypothetical protein